MMHMLHEKAITDSMPCDQTTLLQINVTSARTHLSYLNTTKFTAK